MNEKKYERCVEIYKEGGCLLQAIPCEIAEYGSAKRKLNSSVLYVFWEPGRNTVVASMQNEKWLDIRAEILADKSLQSRKSEMFVENAMDFIQNKSRRA